MKKLLIALTAVLAFGSGVADAAVPEGGYFLDKNGVPLTKEQSTPPKLKTHPTPPMSRLVYNAVKALPHSSSTIILLTVNEDGFPVGPAVTQSAGSVILDEYAVNSVKNWTFVPAKMGDKTISHYVAVPVRFVSLMVATPSAIKNQPMKTPSAAEKEAAERNHHPLMHVSVHIESDGTIKEAPVALENEQLNEEDFKLLARYAEKCVRDWTFTPAVNPDGEIIPEDTVLAVQL